MVQDWTRDAFPRQQGFQPYYQGEVPTRQQSFQQDRYTADVVPRQQSFQQDRCLEGIEDARMQDGSDLRRQPPMQIDDALRSHCGIAAKQYFVAAIMEDGSPMTFFSPSPGGQRMSEATIRQFFDANRFRQVMSRIELGADPTLDDSFGFEDPFYGRPATIGRSRMLDRRRSSVFQDWNGSPARQGRKRPRGRHPINDDDDVPMTVSSRRGIKIGDSDAVWSFYEQRFKNCQQTACKLIAKAWVKAVEPKKQSTHPYTGSDEKAPDWWPKPWGPTKDDKVRHKEPDHLYKRERVHLLAHILRLVVEPNGKQHVDIQKLGLNVKKLEETTIEALSAFFMDNETNAKKRPYLNEIFKVARQEERFMNGEIDGSTEIYVMAEDKMPEAYADDEDEAGFIKDEEENDLQRSRSTTHALVPTATTETNSTTNLRNGSFMNELPVRRSQFPTPIMSDLSAQHSFVENGGMSVHTGSSVNTTNGSLTLDMVPSPHDASRRPSVYSEYASPGGNMYPQQWPPASAGPSASPMYPYSSQPTNSQTTSFVNPTVPMNSNQPFMAGSFDASPRTEFDANGNPMFRASDLTQAPVSQQGYSYLATDGRGLRVMSQVVDPVNRASMQ